MKAIFRNAMNEVNYGTVLDVHPGGLLKIAWQPFDQLIKRIVKETPGQKEIAFATLGSRVGWSRSYPVTQLGDSLLVVPEAHDRKEFVNAVSSVAVVAENEIVIGGL